MEPAYTAYLQGSLKLDRFGRWYHNGKAFEHPRLIQLFNRSVSWDQDHNCFVLRIGQARAVFECEDTAYFVRELLIVDNCCKLRLSDDSLEKLDLKSLCVGSEGQIYCSVKRTLRARFCRAAHQQLLAYGVDEKTLMLGGVRVELKECGDA